jgi:hypothetical protein
MPLVPQKEPVSLSSSEVEAITTTLLRNSAHPSRLSMEHRLALGMIPLATRLEGQSRDAWQKAWPVVAHALTVVRRQNVEGLDRYSNSVQDRLRYSSQQSSFPFSFNPDKTNPNDVLISAHAIQGFAYAQIESRDAATQSFYTALQIDPYSDFSLNLRGLATLLALGKTPESRNPILLEAIAKALFSLRGLTSAEHFHTVMLLGHAHLQNGRLLEARKLSRIDAPNGRNSPKGPLHAALSAEIKLAQNRKKAPAFPGRQSIANED